jgi:N-methylhydantoinase A
MPSLKSHQPLLKLGIDTGGTFTDFFLQTSEAIQTFKISSTPDDPSRAILKGLSHFFAELPPELEIIHGTTVGTNSFLERKGAKTLLVTTHGFEDILTIGRQNRPSLYDLNVERPAEIIPRENIVGVKERVLWDGTVQTPLGTSVGKRLRRICRSFEIESVAVCFLHSYANPDHEKRIRDELAPLGLPVTLSSELLPEFREYERLVTTVINAYLAPVISSYIHRLNDNLTTASLSVQQSNGSVLPARFIEKRAVHTVLSGPAGGVQGAFYLAREMSIDKIITFDMGGTSTDVSLCDGGPTLTREHQIDGYPVGIQVMDIHTVGAGGGSIARIDQGGLLHVGPESAGADPGPVCYGRGTDITVTDANLFLGRLLPDRFLGGRMILENEAGERCMAELADRLDMETTQAALGIIRIVNVGMARAIRAVSVERGYDPKDFILFSFGGASGLHCCALAEELEIDTIVVPARAGILSAQGMAQADPALDYSKPLFLAGDKLRSREIDAAFAGLIKNGRVEMEDICGRGDLEIERFLDLRYQGQSFELTIPYDKDFRKKFHQLHELHFGYAMENAPLELISIRCTLRLKREKQPLPRQLRQVFPPPEIEGQSTVLFEEGRARVNLYLRKRLLNGHSFSGPALIIDDYTTILVTKDFHVRVDSLANLIMEQKSASSRLS